MAVLTKEEKESVKNFELMYSEYNKSDLHSRSIEIANTLMKYYPNSWESKLKSNIEYRVITQIIKNKK